MTWEEAGEPEAEADDVVGGAGSLRVLMSLAADGMVAAGSLAVGRSAVGRLTEEMSKAVVVDMGKMVAVGSLAEEMGKAVVVGMGKMVAVGSLKVAKGRTAACMVACMVGDRRAGESGSLVAVGAVAAFWRWWMASVWAVVAVWPMVCYCGTVGR